MEGLGRQDEAVANFTAAAAIDPQHVAAERLSELNASNDR